MQLYWLRRGLLAWPQLDTCRQTPACHVQWRCCSEQGFAEAAAPVITWPQRTEVRWSHDWGVGGQARSCSVPSSWCQRLHGVLPRRTGSVLADKLKRVWTIPTTPKGLPTLCPSAALLHLCSRGQASPKLQRGQNLPVPSGTVGSVVQGRGVPEGRDAVGPICTRVEWGGLHPDQQQPLVSAGCSVIDTHWDPHPCLVPRVVAGSPRCSVVLWH